MPDQILFWLGLNPIAGELWLPLSAIAFAPTQWTWQRPKNNPESDVNGAWWEWSYIVCSIHEGSWDIGAIHLKITWAPQKCRQFVRPQPVGGDTMTCPQRSPWLTRGWEAMADRKYACPILVLLPSPQTCQPYGWRGLGEAIAEFINSPYMRVHANPAKRADEQEKIVGNLSHISPPNDVDRRIVKCPSSWLWLCPSLIGKSSQKALSVYLVNCPRLIARF